MKRADLGAIVEYEGKLHEVYAIGEGRTVHLRPVSPVGECPRCGRQDHPHLLEHSPLFQEHVKSVKTVEGS